MRWKLFLNRGDVPSHGGISRRVSAADQSGVWNREQLRFDIDGHPEREDTKSIQVGALEPDASRRNRRTVHSDL